MNFIMKFLDKTTSYANKYTVQREYDKLQETVRALQKSLGEIEDSLNQRIFALEEKFEPKLSNDDASWTTTDAIIDVLTKQDGNKLHYSSIYALIKDYNLINPNVTIQSVSATLYGLARQNRINLCNETETGMFFIKTKKGS